MASPFASKPPKSNCGSKWDVVVLSAARRKVPGGAAEGGGGLSLPREARKVELCLSVGSTLFPGWGFHKQL